MDKLLIDREQFEYFLGRIRNFKERVEQICETNQDKNLQKWLDGSDVCFILNISKKTLIKLRHKGKISFTKVGKKVLYLSDDIVTYVEKSKR